MEATSSSPIPADCGAEADFSTFHQSPASIASDHTSCSRRPSPHQSSAGCAQSTTDAAIGGHSRREDDIALLARIVADVLKDSVAELRKGDEARASQFTSILQGELSALRKSEENRIARLEKAITGLKPPSTSVDPTTNFWTAYKKVADEHDNDLVSKYVGDLDTSLLFAGLFSAVTTTFIVQIIPQIQPNSVDLTNVLLLRILQHNTSFDGTDPLAPVSSVPVSVVRAQAILFASLSITLVVAFIAVLGKQWILYYTQASTWGNIIDRGKERQAKLVGLQKWGLHLIMESLPVMLQFALLLFGAALVVYLWDLDISAAYVVLVAISIGCVFYGCIAVAATIWSSCPFQTPLSVLLPKVLPWAKEFITLARVWLRHWARRRIAALLTRAERVTEHGYLASSLKSVSKTFTRWAKAQNHADEETTNNDTYMRLSNPTFWRHDPLLTSSIPKDIAASAGFWLLENSTDFSAASAVAAVFSEFQWPSHYRSTTALIRLRDTYMEYLRVPKFNKSTRLKALQSAAAYYVLYHTQLIWSTSKSLEVELGLSDLPPDLFLHEHGDKWGGDDVFEYLLRIEDRSEPVTSARFLSYIAPYWFCGDSNSSIKFRPSRLQTLYELIEVLEKSRALNPRTLTDCVLCVGAAMDFPLHPEDLIRVDKSDYLASTFKMVVEHIHRVVLNRGRRRRYATRALGVLLTLVEKTTFPLVDATWINELLKSVAGGDVDDEIFALFLRLSARRKEEDATPDAETPDGQDHVHVQGREMDPHPLGGAVASETSTPENSLFSKILKSIKIGAEKESGWQDEAVYGGLVAIRDICQLGSSPFDTDALQMLHDAMDKSKPFRVRKAAYDVMLVTRDGWLKSTELREKLEDLDFPRRLHSVVIETARSEYQRSFLVMMEILSEDRRWHPYLRRSMEIWLTFRHEEPEHTLIILVNVGELLLPGYDSSGPPPLDDSLEKRLEDEWAAVPGRPVHDLTADRLQPLVEVTEQFNELSFNESDRRAVLAMVERVISFLKKRYDSGYEGPGEDICSMVNGLIEKLQLPMPQSTRRRSTYHW